MDQKVDACSRLGTWELGTWELLEKAALLN
jgi:hypothetical protein